MSAEKLHALAVKIARELSQRPECFVTHPAEVRVLQQLPRGELEEFAHSHGWRVIRRLGGRQLQFYNDTNERLKTEGETETYARGGPSR